YNFIRNYLRVAGKEGQAEEERMMAEIRIFSLASNLFWGLWSIVNAKLSQIPFGYWKNKEHRFEEETRVFFALQILHARPATSVPRVVNHGDPVHGCGARLPAVVARHAQRSGRAVRSRWRAEPGRRARRQSVPRRSHLRFHHIQRCRKLFCLRSNKSTRVEVSPIALCQNEHQISETDGQMLQLLHQRNNESFDTIKRNPGRGERLESFFRYLPLRFFRESPGLSIRHDRKVLTPIKVSLMASKVSRDATYTPSCRRRRPRTFLIISIERSSSSSRYFAYALVKPNRLLRWSYSVNKFLGPPRRQDQSAPVATDASRELMHVCSYYTDARVNLELAPLLARLQCGASGSLTAYIVQIKVTYTIKGTKYYLRIVDYYSIDSSHCQDFSPRILGGQDAEPNQAPWMAAIVRFGTDVFCGGALITRKHILTAAHCVSPYKTKQISVMLGTPDQQDVWWNGKLELHWAKKLDYSSDHYKEKSPGMGMITLKKEVTLSETIRTIPLAVTKTPANVWAVLTGYGYQQREENGGDVAWYLQTLPVRIVEHGRCGQLLEGLTTVGSQSLCGYTSPTQGACLFFSGKMKNFGKVDLTIRKLRKFFRRWELDPFMELIHYRLEILCCNMIIEQLTNNDLYLRSLAGTTLMNLLAALFMVQLLFIVGVGGVQLRSSSAPCSASLCALYRFACNCRVLKVYSRNSYKQPKHQILKLECKSCKYLLPSSLANRRGEFVDSLLEREMFSLGNQLRSTLVYIRRLSSVENKIPIFVLATSLNYLKNK
ncbi:unnamed protein product, partial [Trichogramma brassicae]